MEDALQHIRRRLLSGFLLALLATFAGCMPHGPLSIAPLFPPCEGCEQGQQQGPPAAPPAGNGMGAQTPMPNFFPVPTRPVYTPWAVDDAVATSGGLLTMSRTMIKPPPQMIVEPPISDTSPANDAIARRSMPTPLPPDDSATPLIPSDSSRRSAGGSSSPGWHAGSSQY